MSNLLGGRYIVESRSYDQPCHEHSREWRAVCTCRSRREAVRYIYDCLERHQDYIVEYRIKDLQEQE